MRGLFVSLSPVASDFTPDESQSVYIGSHNTTRIFPTAALMYPVIPPPPLTSLLWAHSIFELVTLAALSARNALPLQSLGNHLASSVFVQLSPSQGDSLGPSYSILQLNTTPSSSRAIHSTFLLSSTALTPNCWCSAFIHYIYCLFSASYVHLHISGKLWTSK
jgi:hypothetical protein